MRHETRAIVAFAIFSSSFIIPHSSFAAATAAALPADRIPVKITAGPRDYEILQQAADGFARVTVAGTYLAHEEGKRCDVWVRVVHEDDMTAVDRTLDWQSTLTTTDGTWCAELAIPAGGLYRLETVRRVRGLRLDWNPKGEAVAHFGVGDVWLIAGQSNADGNGRAAAYDPPELGVHQFRHSGEWGLAAHPLHDGTRSKYCADYLTANHSPWLSFAKTLKRRLGYPIGLIPAALGGSGIASWLPEMKGELFDAMKRISTDASGRRIKGVVWYQGCTDTLTDEWQRYYARLDSFLRQTRAFFGDEKLPVVLIQLNRVIDHPAGYSSNGKWEVIREDQRQAYHRMTNVCLVSTQDLTTDDTIHNSSSCNLLLGHRAAQAALGGVYGRNVTWRSPDAKRAVRTADGKGFTVDFDSVEGDFEYRCSDPALFPFRVEDEKGAVGIRTVKPAAYAQLAFTLERALVGKAKVVGCPGVSPSYNVPKMRPAYLPMYAFTLEIKPAAPAAPARPRRD